MIFSQRVGLTWFCISKNCSAIKDGDCQEMGGTSREGFLFPWSGSNFQDGRQDGHIGCRHHDKRHQ